MNLYRNDLLSLIVSVQVDRSTSDGFHIDLDDFLTGLLLLANELVSLHLNVIFCLPLLWLPDTFPGQFLISAKSL